MPVTLITLLGLLRLTMLTCAGGPLPTAKPLSFTLGPGHRVEVVDTDVVVTYNGVEKRIAMGLAAGMVPLPMRYARARSSTCM